ncbi:MAG: hypothetical protein ACFFA0_13440 [Promethearchaeota archaeon]
MGFQKSATKAWAFIDSSVATGLGRSLPWAIDSPLATGLGSSIILFDSSSLVFLDILLNPPFFRTMFGEHCSV